MKDILEEYGGVILAVVLGLSVLVGYWYMNSEPRGEIHRMASHWFVSNGAKTTSVIEEWGIGEVVASYRDDGTLYITGSGELPSYTSLEATPWADEAENIDRISISSDVNATSNIPYKRKIDTSTGEKIIVYFDPVEKVDIEIKNE